MIYTVITPPTEYPVTLAQAKSFARVYRTDEDDWFDLQIETATTYAQVYTNRTYGVTTYSLQLARFTRCITIEQSPFVALDSFTYVDTDGVTQNVDNTEYTVVNAHPYTQIIFNTDYVFPDTEDNNPYPIVIEFQAGYTQANCPATVKTAIMQLVTDIYEHRQKNEEFFLHENSTYTELLNSNRLVYVP